MQRNPYAPPQAPVSDAGLDKLSADEYLALGAYGGFWRRFLALFLDGLFLSPLSILAYFGVQQSRMFYAWYIVPSTAIMLGYYVYLVYRFGGTPGKRIMGMRIVTADKTPLTFRAAFMRNSVVLLLAVLSSLGTAIGGMAMSDTEYSALGYLEKMQQMVAHAPKWVPYISWIDGVWFIAGIIVLLSNRRKRATHDFMAGTVVIRN